MWTIGVIGKKNEIDILTTSKQKFWGVLAKLLYICIYTVYVDNVFGGLLVKWTEWIHFLYGK